MKNEFEQIKEKHPEAIKISLTSYKPSESFQMTTKDVHYYVIRGSIKLINTETKEDILIEEGKDVLVPSGEYDFFSDENLFTMYCTVFETEK